MLGGGPPSPSPPPPLVSATAFEGAHERVPIWWFNSHILWLNSHIFNSAVARGEGVTPPEKIFITL